MMMHMLILITNGIADAVADADANVDADADVVVDADASDGDVSEHVDGKVV